MYFFPILTCFLLILIDQIIKFLTVKKLAPIMSFKIIENFFYLTYVENRGAAFGFLSGARWIFVSITIIVLIGACIYYVKISKEKNTLLTRIAIIMIASGAFGNCIDRIFRGYVVDMFHFIFWGHDFAVFNFADILVCIGTALLAVVIIFYVSEDKKNNLTAGEKGNN